MIGFKFGFGFGFGFTLALECELSSGLFQLLQRFTHFGEGLGGWRESEKNRGRHKGRGLSIRDFERISIYLGIRTNLSWNSNESIVEFERISVVGFERIYLSWESNNGSIFG
jgi:hypothetical protein